MGVSLLILLCWNVQMPGDLEIVRQMSVVARIGADAEPLKARLASEVRKMIDAGPLRPFRVQYGEGHENPALIRRYYNEPWQALYTFARAYPHLPESLKAHAVAYIRREELRNNAWGPAPLRNDEGTLRQPDNEPSGKGSYKRRGTMIYALWLWCSVTGDNSLVKASWNKDGDLKKIYAAMESGEKTYELIAASIAMARLAARVGAAEDVSAYEGKALALMAQGRTFPAFRDNAFRDYTGTLSGGRGTENMAWPLFYLTPETARYMSQDAKLKQSVIDFVEAVPATQTNNGNAGVPGFVLWTFPLWYMAQPPNGDWGFFGNESCSIGPETRMMLFNYFAWIKNETAVKMAFYADVPDALIGDCYHMQNLVTAIEQYGVREWK